MTVEADDIWDRALNVGEVSELTYPGDIAMARVLLAHGSVMNGGVLNYVEEYDATEVADAEAAYRWLGAGGVGDLIDRVRAKVATGLGLKQLETLERTADDAYGEVIGDDEALLDLLRVRLADFPDAFAPLD